MFSFKYALITPARNEEDSIKKTLESIVSQRLLPVKWVIVSDASEDKTDEIVSNFSAAFNFIHFVRKETIDKTGFASKVDAFNLGLTYLSDEVFDFLGNLDADIILKPDYYISVLKEFERNPKLGIAGGRVYEQIGNKCLNRKSCSTSVAGAVQLFRKSCYNQIGGYIPLVNGGIDSAAEIIARSKGWEVKTFIDLPVLHIGPVLTGTGFVLKRKFIQGMTHYQMGYKPLFELIRQLYRITDKPYMLGAFARISGYFWALLLKMDFILPSDALQYFRKEQSIRMNFISNFINKIILNILKWICLKIEFFKRIEKWENQ